MGKQRHPARAAAVVVALAALCTASALPFPEPAVAAPPILEFAKPTLPELRADAAAVREQISRLDNKAQIAVERYNEARATLDDLSARAIETRRALVTAEKRLDDAQAVLAARMALIYKSGGLGVLDILLEAENFTEVDTQLDYYRLIGEADRNTVDKVGDLERQVSRLHDRLERERAAALERETELAERRTHVEEGLAERRELLRGIDRRIKTILEQQAELAANSAGIDIDDIVGSRIQGAVVAETMRWLGVPYVWAGASPSGGFDCSGLVMYVFAKYGVSLPHAATYQARMGTPVPFSRLEPADLVFFGSSSFYHHVGIYIGGGRFIEAPHTGDVIKISVLAGRGAALACRYPLRLR